MFDPYNGKYKSNETPVMIKRFSCKTNLKCVCYIKQGKKQITKKETENKKYDGLIIRSGCGI